MIRQLYKAGLCNAFHSHKFPCTLQLFHYPSGSAIHDSIKITLLRFFFWIISVFIITNSCSSPFLMCFATFVNTLFIYSFVYWGYEVPRAMHKFQFLSQDGLVTRQDMKVRAWGFQHSHLHSIKLQEPCAPWGTKSAKKTHTLISWLVLYGW